MKARKQIKGYALGGGIGGYDAAQNMTTTQSGSQFVGKNYNMNLGGGQKTIDSFWNNRNKLSIPNPYDAASGMSQSVQSDASSPLVATQPTVASTATAAAQIPNNTVAKPYSGLWTEDPNRSRTWVDQRAYDQQKAADASTATAAATANPPTATPSQPAQKIAGLARGGKTPGSRPIHGKVDPMVADDVTINAKKGEFVLSVEDVALLGGADKLEADIKQLRKQAGLPTEMGPKRPDEPDAMGRMDKPGLNGKAGLASAGEVKEILGSNDYGTGAADTNITNKIAGSPAAATVGFLGEGIARGAALPVAATMDVLNKGVNAAGQFFGFNPGLSTDNTARVSDMSGQTKPAAIPTTPPAQSRPTQQQSTAPAPAAKPAIAIAEKPAAVAAAPPAQGAQSVNGIKQFEISKTIPGSGDTWRKGLNGKPYQVTGTNADGTRFDNDGFSRQMAADRQQAGIDAKYAMEVEQAQKYASAQKEAHNNRSLQQHFNELLYSRNTLGIPENEMWQLAGKNFAAQQEMNKANTAAESQKYAADQSLAGHKYTSDGNVKAHEITGKYGLLGHQATAEGNIEAHRIAGVAKGLEAQQKAQHEAYTKDEKEMKDLLTNKYGVDPNVSLPAYKKHLSDLRAWDNKVTKQFADLKKSNSGYAKEAGKLENYMRVYHTDPASKEGQSALVEAKKLVTGGGAGNPPPWFDMMTQKPVFNHNTLPKLPSSNQVQG